MSRARSPKGFSQRVPGVQTALQKSVRRTLAKRSSGLSSLRKNVTVRMARCRLEGMTDAEIVTAPLAIAADVARATGNDRIDLVTGEPRRAYVANAITRIVASAELGRPVQTQEIRRELRVIRQGCDRL